MLQEVAASDTSIGQKAVLDLIKTMMVAGHLHLYKDTFVPNVNSTLADFVAAEADYTGYAAAVMTYSADALDAEGGWVSQSSRLFFQATADTPDNSIGGAFVVVEDTPDSIYEYFVFPLAVNMSTDLASLTAVVAFREPHPDSIIVEN